MSVKLNSQDINRIKTHIKDKLGLSFTSLNEKQLLDKINNRCDINKIERFSDYYNLINHNQSEFDELISELTNNETYFFREARQLDFLVDFIIPQIESRNLPQEKISILSLGCSSGAEPYSIAMLLDEKFVNPENRFTIIGADLDKRILAKARTGIYRALEFRSIAAEIKARYFSLYHNGSYILNESIRNRVNFKYMNVVDDCLKDDIGKFDVIFFRNVSIYFDHQTRKKIIKNISTLLKDNGYLLVGLTETMSNDFGFLTLKEESNIFYFHKNNEPVDSRSRISKKQDNLHIFPKLPLSVFSGKNNKIPEKIVGKTASNQDIDHSRASKPASLIATEKLNDKAQSNVQANHEPFDQLPDLLLLLNKKNYAELIPQLEKLLDTQPGRYEYALLLAYVFYNQLKFIKASEYIELATSLEPFSVDVFLLSGMIAKWKNLTEQAIAEFKKAIYIQANCWPAHYYLAGLYQLTNNTEKAISEYKLVLQQLSDNSHDYLNTLIVPHDLPVAEIKLLSQTRIQQLNSQHLSGAGVNNGY